MQGSYSTVFGHEEGTKKSGLRISGFGLKASGFGFRVSGIGYRVSGFRSRVSGFGVGLVNLDAAVHEDGTKGISSFGF